MRYPDDFDDFDDSDQSDSAAGQPTPVPKLTWYESLRVFLEPYQHTDYEKEADQSFTSAEIIQAIETHHNVPQGVVGKCIYNLIDPNDFLRAMRYLGFREKNVGGFGLEWQMKKKPPTCHTNSAEAAGY